MCFYILLLCVALCCSLQQLVGFHNNFNCCDLICHINYILELRPFIFSYFHTWIYTGEYMPIYFICIFVLFLCFKCFKHYFYFTIIVGLSFPMNYISVGCLICTLVRLVGHAMCSNTVVSTQSYLVISISLIVQCTWGLKTKFSSWVNLCFGC